MLLSIIVPIYGVEKYLPACIDSLISLDNVNQYEILLINDGSQDNCKLICERYNEKYSNIFYYEKENGGLSDARNYGLMIAKGRYIMFVDGDDSIEKDSIPKIISRISNEDSDIICFGSHHIKNDVVVDSKYTSIDLKKTGKDFLKFQCENGTFYAAVWNNLYRKNFLIDNELFFKFGILHEDNEWTPRVFIKAASVVIGDCVFYKYYLRDNSICTKRDLTKNISDMRDTLLEMPQVFKNLKDDIAFSMIKDGMVSAYLGLFGQGAFYKKKEFFVDNNFILKDLYFKRTKRKARIYVLSKKIFCLLYRIKNKA